MGRFRIPIAVLFFLWAGFNLATFYVVQKPSFLQVTSGLGSTALTVLITVLLVIDATGIGQWVLGKLRIPAISEIELLLIGSGLGLGIFGLAGFGIASTGMAKPVVILVILAGVLVWLFWKGQMELLLKHTKELLRTWKESNKEAPIWLRMATLVAFFLVFILALAPPVEAFDALLYHLSVPASWLSDGGLRLVNIFPYWFPQLVEGIFIWPMALGSDRAPQLIHFTFCLLTFLLLWDWSRRLWNNRTSWWVLALLMTMPSLFWLAAWAYTDLALSFFTLVVLYTVWKWHETEGKSWLALGGLMAGCAMGIKYTSFLVPITSLIFILWWGRRDIWKTISSCSVFCGLAILVALPWYLRNYFWMSNPFYPFVFGGPFWDSFRDQIYSGTGTGIGWNLYSILLLPLETTLGYRDATFFDGRIGPFFLIMLPISIWTLWHARQNSSSQRSALFVTAGFAIITAFTWTYGVIQTANLWQSRLLLPGILPFILVMATGMDQLRGLDTQRLKISFIVSTLTGLVILAGLLDFGLQVAFRNPLMAAIGAESRMDYTARLQPGYANALELVQLTPPNAYIYFLFEPRSYGMPRRVQPDPLNDNWAHDLYLHGSAEASLSYWRSQGFTHVLISRAGADMLFKIAPDQAPSLEKLTGLLKLLEKSTDGKVELYQIPIP
jgi:hypothetical protein